jgi:hypothetical protein
MAAASDPKRIRNIIDMTDTTPRREGRRFLGCGSLA